MTTPNTRSDWLICESSCDARPSCHGGERKRDGGYDEDRRHDRQRVEDRRHVEVGPPVVGNPKMSTRAQKPPMTKAAGLPAAATSRSAPRRRARLKARSACEAGDQQGHANPDPRHRREIPVACRDGGGDRKDETGDSHSAEHGEPNPADLSHSMHRQEFITHWGVGRWGFTAIPRLRSSFAATGGVKVWTTPAIAVRLRGPSPEQQHGREMSLRARGGEMTSPGVSSSPRVRSNRRRHRDQGGRWAAR